MNNKYAVAYKLNLILVNKILGLLITVLIPLLSVGASVYFSNRGDVTLPKIFAFKKDAPEEAAAKVKRVGDTEDKYSGVFKPHLNPLRGTPLKLEIRNKSDNTIISANIVKVGIDEEGTLETPSNSVDSGWLQNSARPGENGNMIINAHYDDSSGQPAAFWQLKTVEVGDKVVVEDAFGKKYAYRVTEKFFVDIHDPDRTSIYENPDSASSVVTLITCGGVWVPGLSSYNKRLVVKAEIMSDVAVSIAVR